MTKEKFDELYEEAYNQIDNNLDEHEKFEDFLQNLYLSLMDEYSPQDTELYNETIKD